jgi:Putative  PD-(D/E)XK family member, (DUF4420)
MFLCEVAGTMKASDLLRWAWTTVDAEVAERPGYYRRRLDGMGSMTILAGMEVPGKLRKISFAFSRANSIPENLAHQTRGYNVVIDNESADGPVLVNICETGQPLPKDLFLFFCTDLIENVIVRLTEKEAIQVLHSRLQHWHQFFQDRPNPGLSREEYVGLYAELDFLERCLLAGVSPVHIVQSWSGPLGANQDFLLGSLAIEVKATIGNDPDLMRISNARQLDETGLERLHLAHCTYDFRKNSGQTLRVLAQAIKSRLKTEASALAAFEERLSFAGLVETASGPYEDFGLTNRKRRYYRITESFPRILESSVARGVSDICYSVHLSAAEEFRMDEDDFMKYLPMEEIDV